MNKKKIIIIFAVAAFLVILLLLLIREGGPKIFNKGEDEKVFVPEFLSSSEKQSMGIPEETKIQVINRDKDGEVSIYRVIESDDQIVNPGEIGPISPRTEPLEQLKIISFQSIVFLSVIIRVVNN